MANPTPKTFRLSETGLPKILMELKQRRFTGIVRVYRNDQDKSLFFKDGDFIFASSRYPDDRLGEQLLRQGRITLEQYRISVEFLLKTGKRQGTILVEQGFITPGELFESVESQVKDILLSLFTWIEGDVEIREEPLPSEEVISLRISTANVILQGIKRINDWTLLFNKLPRLETVPVKTSNPMILYQDIKFSSLEEAFLELIDGQRSISRLFDESPLPPFDTLKLLHFLKSIGFIETGDSEEMPAIASASPPVLETAPLPEPEAVTPPSNPMATREDPPIKSEVPSDKPVSAPVVSPTESAPKAAASPKEVPLKETTPPAAPEPEPATRSEEPASPPAVSPTDSVPKAAAAPPPADDPAQAVKDAYAALGRKNHYDVLGLSQTATREEIKRAYFKLAREYHPDRHLQEGMAGLKPMLEALCKRITEAYETLVMESKRRDYDSRL